MCSSSGSRRRLWISDQDRAEIIDVGQCRTGDDLIPQAFEEAMPVVIRKPLLRLNALCRRAREGVGCDQRACYFFGPVYSVGIPGHGEDARKPIKPHRE